jgi:L-amino acid N-acyltransferase YncA
VRADLREARPRQPLPPCVIREARPEDRGFIFGNYLKSAYSSFAYRNMPAPAFQHFAARLLEQLIERSQVLVVHRKDDENALLAFAVSERPFKGMSQIVLHFMYIKHDYREQGLGGAILKAIGHDPDKTQLFATHMTSAWFHIGPKFGAIYNPFFLWPQFQTDKEIPS